MSGDIKRAIRIACYVVFIGILAAGLWFYLYQKSPDSIKPPEPPTSESVAVQHKTTNTTTYQYVPKVTPQDPDVEVLSKPKPITVAINGVKHEIPTDTVKEEHKLDNGKLVVTEEREVKLNLTIPEQPKLKKGVYIENDLSKGTQDINVGVRASYQTKDFDVDLKAELWTKKDKDKRITATVTKWF